MKFQLPKIAQPGYASRWVENLNSDLYHADKSSVGSSDLRRVLKSPHNFYQAMADAALPDDEPQAPCLRFGHIFHLAVLEPKKFFSNYIRMPTFKGTGMKKAKEDWMASITHPDAVIVTEKEFIQIEGMVNSVLSHQDACRLLKHGNAEITGYYRDPTTGIQCKIRPDFINFELMTMVDIKTTRSCRYEDFQRSIHTYRYDIQIGMYCAGVREIMDRPVAHPIYLAIEKTPPYEVALYIADDQLLRHGTEDYNRALGTLHQCLTTQNWPKYQDSLQMIGLPAWAMAK